MNRACILPLCVERGHVMFDSPHFVIMIYANEEGDDDYKAIVYQAYSALLSSTNVTVPYRT